MKTDSMTVGLCTENQTVAGEQTRPSHSRRMKVSSQNAKVGQMVMAIDPHVEAIVLQVLASVGLLEVHRRDGQVPYIADSDIAYIRQRFNALQIA
jgi:hypothetical protein